ncbi:hypothetical protein OIU77_007665 [Salix suchowensis]|uniref:Uncharacterized protein n=1 Tax=Salix suchowensis TaxID=1278906 RepID=A0ABQ9AGX2_9ROSI|nr:hypothetical protein OIU77_007665 [Salix suchowensis]
MCHSFQRLVSMLCLLNLYRLDIVFPYVVICDSIQLLFYLVVHCLETLISLVNPFFLPFREYMLTILFTEISSLQWLKILVYGTGPLPSRTLMGKCSLK